MVHRLKTLPCYFAAVLSGDKTFEIRDNRDHGFQKGDTVILEEYDPEISISLKRYTGRRLSRKITYVTNFEQSDHRVVFGFRNTESPPNSEEEGAPDH